MPEAAEPLPSPTYDAPTQPDADPALVAERNHLAESRSALGRMRDRAHALKESDAAGDWVSAEYLASTYQLRLQQLADDPTTPLFFGRLDYQPGAGPDEDVSDAQRYYIGRRHVNDDEGDPMVVDWRASVSVPFYRASPKAPMGVELRRRFGFVHGDLTAYEDEHLGTGEERWPGASAERRKPDSSTPGVAADVGEPDRSGALPIQYSAILEQEIEKPRVGPMRDIVATIQPEQDVLVRSNLTETVCVQGAPGTGKTAVGLHRAAYLLYAHREQLGRQGVLVVGPNASFLRYIGDVLPALGEVQVTQTTVADLVARPGGKPLRVRGEDAPHVAVLKGDARMAELLRRAVWAHLSEPREGLIVTRGSRRFRIPAYESAELAAGVRDRGVRYDAGRAMLPQRLAHAVLLRMEAAGDSPDDRVQNTVARSKPVKEYAAQVWPAVDGAKLLYRLFTEPELLATHADGLLDHEERAALLWAGPTVPRSAGTARWSAADAVLLDELADLLNRTPSVGHVVLDEAQDLSPMQLRAVGRRCATGSATILGDLAQATTPWATRAWPEALDHLGKPAAHLEELTAGFRVPSEVIGYAARLLPRIAPGLVPPTSVRRTTGDFAVHRVEATGAAIAAAIRVAERRPGSIGVIVADAGVPDARSALRTAGVAHTLLGTEPDEEAMDAHVDVVPASLAKGLEFDHVIVVEPAAIVAGEPDETTGLRRLYVCLTRAVTSLCVVHAGDLPELLG